MARECPWPPVSMGGFTDGHRRLLVDGRDATAVEVMASGPARRHGLLDREGLEGRCR